MPRNGTRGLNFHDPRGTLVRPYPYRELRDDALAHRLSADRRGVKPGDRIALIAETGAEFAALFFGTIYAGAWPVPLPLPTSFGGRDTYVDQLERPAHQLRPDDAVLPARTRRDGGRGRRSADGVPVDWSEFAAKPAPVTDLPAAAVGRHLLSAVQQRIDALSARRRGHPRARCSTIWRRTRTAWKCGDSDRCVSWLPWYHDMGLVGCLLSPVANQVSIDYLKTEDFARRPLAWLDLISRNPGTTLSYSPTFGYDICARRVSSQTHVADRFDLSRWRVAGNGADMIRPDVMQSFVDAFADAGFKASAFLPSYGLAEATLAVSIMPPGEGIVVELVEETELSGAASRCGPPDALSRHRQLRQAPRATW